MEDMVLRPHRVLELMVLVEGEEDMEDQEAQQLTGVEDPLLIHQRDMVGTVMEEEVHMVGNRQQQQHIPLGDKEDQRAIVEQKAMHQLITEEDTREVDIPR